MNDPGNSSAPISERARLAARILKNKPTAYRLELDKTTTGPLLALDTDEPCTVIVANCLIAPRRPHYPRTATVILVCILVWAASHE